MIRAFGCAPRSLNDNRHISDDSRETLCKTYPVKQWDTTSWIYVVLFAILKTKNSITISEMFFSWKNIATKPLLNLQLMIFAVLRAAFQLSPSSAASPCQGLLPEKKTVQDSTLNWLIRWSYVDPWIALRVLHSYFSGAGVAPSFLVCLSVSEWDIGVTRKNLYFFNIAVLYWPSTQLHHLVTHSWANWISFAYLVSPFALLEIRQKLLDSEA